MKDILENNLNPTIESNSFGIDLKGSFRTASFGGESLEHSNQPAPAAAPIPGVGI